MKENIEFRQTYNSNISAVFIFDDLGLKYFD